MQNNSFYCNTQDFFLSSAALIACQAHQHTGDRLAQNNMNVRHEVGGEVIINEPTWTQVGHALVQRSLVFSRFNLKHKQRPTPGK